MAFHFIFRSLLSFGQEFMIESDFQRVSSLRSYPRDKNYLLNSYEVLEMTISHSMAVPMNYHAVAEEKKFTT